MKRHQHWIAATVLVTFFSLLPSHTTSANNRFSPQWTWDDIRSEQITTIGMNDSGSTLVAGGGDEGTADFGMLVVFDWRSPWPVLDVEFDELVRQVSISDDGRRVACATLYHVYLYDVEDGLLWSQEDDHEIAFVQIDKSGQYVVAARLGSTINTIDAIVYCFDGPTGELLWHHLPGEYLGYGKCLMRDLEISDDAEYVAAVFSVGSATVNGAMIYETVSESRLPHDPVWVSNLVERAGIPNADFSGDGNYLGIVGPNMVRFYDVTDPISAGPDPIWQYWGEGTYHYCHDVEISDDGQVVGFFAGSYLTIEKGEMAILDPVSGDPVWQRQTFYQSASGSISGNGQVIAFSGYEAVVTLDPTTYVLNYDGTGDLLGLDGIGHVELNHYGTTLLRGGGNYVNQAGYCPLAFFRLEENLPPVCEITSPEDGSVAWGSVELTGTALDAEGGIIRVEVLGPEGVIHAHPVDDDLSNWTCTMNIFSSENGEFTFKARAVDEVFKYGTWEECTVRIELPGMDTPTPDLSIVHVDLQMPGEWYRPGDTFYLTAFTQNYLQSYQNLAFVVALEIHGEFFFWPSWQHFTGDGFDYAVRDCPFGFNTYEIIAPMIWPENTGFGAGMVFYGMLLTPELDELISNLDFMVWGYSS